MNSVHRIRLRGPWEVAPIHAIAGVPPTEAMRMPCPCSWKDGGWPGFAGSARHLRRFGRPRQIDEPERVWLVVDPCACEKLAVALNGVEIGTAVRETTFKSDITERIAERNELVIDLSGSDDDCGLTGEVRLEIRRLT